MLENFHYEVTKKLGVLSDYAGKTKELNLVSFNGGKPKLDLRSWGTVEGKRVMFKGLTLSDEEGELLRDYLADYFQS